MQPPITDDNQFSRCQRTMGMYVEHTLTSNRTTHHVCAKSSCKILDRYEENRGKFTLVFRPILNGQAPDVADGTSVYALKFGSFYLSELSN